MALIQYALHKVKLHQGQDHEYRKQLKNPLVSKRTIILAGITGIGVIFLPLLLMRLNLPFIRTFDDPGSPLPLFQLFTFCASVGLIALATVEIRKYKTTENLDWLPIVLMMLIGFHYLTQLRLYSAKSWDYMCYENAARAIVSNHNPYQDCYLYWPMMAQTLALTYKFIALASAWLVGNVSTNASGAQSVTDWNLVFYFYECLQFFLLILAYFLCYWFSLANGLKRQPAAVVVSILFVFNNALASTLKYNQVNLWVLNLSLLAILLVDRYPLLAGLAVALGGHLKLYPFILLAPWTLTKQWRALTSALISMGIIVLFQTQGGQTWTIWQHFFDFARTYSRDGFFFRDSSLDGIVHNSFQFATILTHGRISLDLATINQIANGAIMLVFGWFAVRFVRRQKIYATICHANNLADAKIEAARNLGFSHAMDALILALIVSPIVWEHHYVLALPIVLWAVAHYGNHYPWQIGASAFLMWVLPTFDVFPLSYHRVMGLVILLYVTAPDPLCNPWLATNLPGAMGLAQLNLHNSLNPSKAVVGQD